MSISDNEKKVLDRAARILEKQLVNGDVFSSPDVVRDYCRFKHSSLEHEVFGILILDNRHRLIKYLDLFRGTIDGAAVYPREVCKEVLKYNGAAVVLCHGHPSGVAEPSDADVRITKKITDACALFDVRVLDHLVCGNPDIVSLAERGLM